MAAVCLSVLLLLKRSLGAANKCSVLVMQYPIVTSAFSVHSICLLWTNLTLFFPAEKNFSVIQHLALLLNIIWQQQDCAYGNNQLCKTSKNEKNSNVLVQSGMKIYCCKFSVFCRCAWYGKIVCCSCQSEELRFSSVILCKKSAAEIWGLCSVCFLSLYCRLNIDAVLKSHADICIRRTGSTLCVNFR